LSVTTTYPTASHITITITTTTTTIHHESTNYLVIIQQLQKQIAVLIAQVGAAAEGEVGGGISAATEVVKPDF